MRSPLTCLATSLCVALLIGLVSAPSAMSQGFAPAKATENMWAADGMRITMFAHEPEIRQPIFVQCDDRGRLWTIQYLQYPNPAGLQRVTVDRWSRTLYDRTPEPPPRGPRGADRITIMEDTNGDGRADRFKDFVTGLNLTTGVAFGHGGVFVLNVPYLLFYPDRNRDDVPDADPQVLLEGFGMEDAQSFSNHLTWGPDGWLYGVNGSTTTCRIRGLEFQQGVWRYHFLRNEFELFCEGGANCYGLTFDELGNLFYSTNGGPFVHALQGGYFYKSFGKHGPLHEPHAYHFFGPLDCDQAPGGPPTGGTVYRHEMLQNKLGGQFIAGNFLGHTASAWKLAPQGSTFRARFQGPFFDARDSWSGPTDLCVGPAGEIYIADFYDQRTAHPDPDATWDSSNGRIYRIVQANPISMSKTAPHDVREMETSQLVQLLCEPSKEGILRSNAWLQDRAIVELASRRDRGALAQLDQLLENSGPQRLRALWARYVVGGLPDETAERLLGDSAEYVRAWTVRLIADDRTASDAFVAKLQELAKREQSAVVRAALASSAKRLPSQPCLNIISALIENADRLPDERVDWSMWWAVEDKAISGRSAVLAWARSTANQPGTAINRIKNLLVRRNAAEGTSESYRSSADILATIPQDHRGESLVSMRDGLVERARQPEGIGQGGLFEFAAVPVGTESAVSIKRFSPIDQPLKEVIARQFLENPNSSVVIELALLAELPNAFSSLNRFVTTTLADSVARNSLTTDIENNLQLVIKYGDETLVPKLLQWLSVTTNESTRKFLLQAVARFESTTIAHELLGLYRVQTSATQKLVLEILTSRSEWSKLLLAAVEHGAIESSEITVGQIARISLHRDMQLDERVKQIWGKVGPGTPEEKLATMRRFNNDLRAFSGDARQGKDIYMKVCGNCHKLHGNGGAIGPDLTSTSRKDTAALLANIVDPSSVIRRESISYVARTDSGSIHTGLLADQDGASITILDAENRRTRISRDALEELRESSVSLMPERLLEPLTPQQLRDLFAFLQM